MKCVVQLKEKSANQRNQNTTEVNKSHNLEDMVQWFVPFSMCISNLTKVLNDILYPKHANNSRI